MTALREMSRAGRQFLGGISHWKHCPASFQRRASTEATTTSAPVIPDIEEDSGLRSPIVTKEDIKITDPRKRASRRNHELPHER